MHLTANPLRSLAASDPGRSIMQVGILSHEKARKIHHISVANNIIQDRRTKVVVPGGLRLHEYVYVCARNPMLFKIRERHLELCILRINTDVLTKAGVMVTDRNASSKYVRFAAGPSGLKIVDHSLTFADDWRDEDSIQYFRKKSAKCAEVLVSDKVEPQFIKGAYVSCEEAKADLRRLVPQLDIIINESMFFR